ncbi:tigger transposable element-derived protein 1-like [Lutzomyia longipalpis]|uniref:tigger transposable element-derived protein 1-like n=1 Tax=Lutzomyia longipalpis TaxID=7200 RepID=UPI002483935F|nr:tigger transposable element-derived protein 1-like [Lutzomyia longipalpis]
MSGKSGSIQKVKKQSRQSITIAVKKAIIAKKAAGIPVANIAEEFGIKKDTIWGILRNQETISKSSVASGITKLSHGFRRTHILDETEALLLKWVGERQKNNDITPQEIICQKARMIFHDLKESPKYAPCDAEFSASRGWFSRFKQRTGIHNVTLHGEAGSGNVEAAADFVQVFSQVMDEKGYHPDMIFNADETGMNWKKLPRTTFVTKEMKRMPGRKPLKDRYTLLLASNASGDYKVKPLMIYNAQNPRAFKKHKVIKSRLPVTWSFSKKSWMTAEIFTKWLIEDFGPDVRQYLIRKGHPLRAILLLDNCSSHPKKLEEKLKQNGLDFIKIQFLPENTTSLIQPMDQQVIATFKKFYTKFLFQRCEEYCRFSGNHALIKFFKEELDVVVSIKIVEEAWAAINEKTLRAAWKNIYYSARNDDQANDESDSGQDNLIREIMSSASNLDLEFDENDLEGLHIAPELSTEDLIEMVREDGQQHEDADENAEGDADENAEGDADENAEGDADENAEGDADDNAEEDAEEDGLMEKDNSFQNVSTEMTRVIHMENIQDMMRKWAEVKAEITSFRLLHPTPGKLLQISEDLNDAMIFFKNMFKE